MKVSDSCTMPVIAGVEINMDDQGRFNLNALHRASQQGMAKQPSNWLRLESTQDLKNELIDSFNSSDVMSIPIVQKEGRAGGTFAHELLAISYAGWISPAFQLQVNQTFLDYRQGKLQPAFNPAQLSRMDILQMAMDAEQENSQLKQQIEDSRPKVAFHDLVTASDQEVPVSEAAKILGSGEQRLFYFLREYGYLMSHGRERNLPYQRYIDQKLFTVKLKSYHHPEDGQTPYRQTLVTGKGLVQLAKHLREIEVRERLGMTA
ncbi:phage antirepressor KilAC domain-containing protein [uncultured Endozoicomonas sp.]|uniref:phage antirepressor KilAC domain-containing protein n=1 Tax=uncultured Endozoicomonas sp. TaxID=432652 RepID=UPI00261FDE9A|nr:phage antirepressor KilAC domain-containing protein [uncultured Endozoicomonas sp.]